LQVLGESEHFPSKRHSSVAAEIVILRVDTKKIEARNFPADIFTRYFLVRGGVKRYAATPLIVALSPSHSDTTRFHLWSPIATRNHLDRFDKIPNVAVEDFDPISGILGPTS
jgi:hypothetical protein